MRLARDNCLLGRHLLCPALNKIKLQQTAAMSADRQPMPHPFALSAHKAIAASIEVVSSPYCRRCVRSLVNMHVALSSKQSPEQMTTLPAYATCLVEKTLGDVEKKSSEQIQPCVSPRMLLMEQAINQADDRRVSTCTHWSGARAVT